MLDQAGVAAAAAATAVGQVDRGHDGIEHRRPARTSATSVAVRVPDLAVGHGQRRSPAVAAGAASPRPARRRRASAAKTPGGPAAVAGTGRPVEPGLDAHRRTSGGACRRLRRSATKARRTVTAGAIRRPAFIRPTPVSPCMATRALTQIPWPFCMTAGAPLRTSGYTLLIADDPSQVAAAQRLRHEVFATELGATLRCPARPGWTSTSSTLLRPPDRPRGRDRRGGRHVPAAAAGARTAGRVRRGRVRPRPRCDPLRDAAGRDRALLRAPGPPLRRGDQPDVGRHRPLPAPARLPLARRLRLGAAGRRRRDRRRRLGPGRRPGTWRRRRCGSARGGPWFAERPTAGRRRAPTGGAVPPLLRGYLRLGAWVCGEPAYDPDFGVRRLLRALLAWTG